ncbi:MAG: transglutaminase-like cysteine peptidase [Candidatus Accumulibacter sp.]|jgi:predicted transglutaminase-like cysteine proteinase|nr:transglutaminase-like cysteine peptidase [Accumulibacter sp.]
MIRASLRNPSGARGFFLPWRGLLAAFAVCLTLSAPFAAAPRDVERLRGELVARFDASRLPLLDAWLEAVSAAARRHREEDKLAQINDFVNANIFFEDDISVWGVSDYWATPLETIGQGRGDCEDFAIIKYVSLRMAGISSAKLRLVYAKARLNGEAGPVWMAHMILAYYAAPDAEPLILDNLDERIVPASRRPDLQPIFSFNSAGIFAGVSGRGAARAAAGIGRLSRWEDAWRRIQADGYQ